MLSNDPGTSPADVAIYSIGKWEIDPNANSGGRQAEEDLPIYYRGNRRVCAEGDVNPASNSNMGFYLETNSVSPEN